MCGTIHMFPTQLWYFFTFSKMSTFRISNKSGKMCDNTDLELSKHMLSSSF